MADQYHDGDGDNVAGDKYVNSSVSPDALERHIEDFLVHIRRKESAKASFLLKTLNLTNNLDSDTKKTLELMSVLLAVELGDVSPDAYQVCNRFVSSDLKSNLKDIGYSALIRLDCFREELNLAHQRYKDICQPGEYLKETYFALIADVEEISSEFIKAKVSGSEGVLCGLVRGALRLSAFELALTISEKLLSFYENFNSKILNFACIHNMLIRSLNEKPYWLIDGTTKVRFDAHIEQLALLFEEGKGRDKRLSSYACQLMTYQLKKQTRLMEVSLKFYSEIKEDYPELCNLLDELQGHIDIEESSIQGKLKKSKSDLSYGANLVVQILNSNEISLEDSYIVQSIAPVDSIVNWLKNCGTVIGANSFEVKISLLELRLIAASEDRTAQVGLKEDLDSFIITYKEEISSLSPLRLQKFCELLVQTKLPHFAAQIISPLLPVDDIWPSPLVDYYIQALIDAEQFKSLSYLLSKIKKVWWTTNLWHVEAFLYAKMGNSKAAIVSLEQVLKLSPENLRLWAWLIGMSRDVYQEEFNVQPILKRIPPQTFNQPSKVGYQLLREFSNSGLDSFAETKLVDWFLDDPVGTAEGITNFFLSTLPDKKEINSSFQVGNCFGGYEFSVDNKVYFKLIIQSSTSSDTHILSAETPLAVHILNMRPGEENMFGAQDIKLIGKVPSMVAIFRLAQEIRHDKNDGTDCFFSLTAPTDPEEFFPYLERKLSAFQGHSPDYLNKPSIPIYMKGKRFGDSHIIDSAIRALTDKRIVSQFPPTFGHTKPDSVVLDPYSICYLAISNLAFECTKYFNNLVLTKETKLCVQEWLRDINREDYLSISIAPNGGLRRTTAEDIKEATAQIQCSLLHILSLAKEIEPELVDFPDGFSIMEDVIDPCTISSYKLAFSNKIHWFCLDPLLARLFEDSGGMVVNVHDCLVLMSENIPAENLDGIQLFATTGFPFVVTYKKLHELVCSDSDYANFIVAEILKKSTCCLQGFREAVEFTYKLITSAMQVFIINSSRYGRAGTLETKIKHFYKLFNACCYEVMQYEGHKESEMRLAIFLYAVLGAYSKDEESYKNICFMAHQFASGHFLNLARVEEHVMHFISKHDQIQIF